MAKYLTLFGGEELFNNDPDGEELKIVGTSFYRGENCNFAAMPGDENWPGFIDRFVIKGLRPAQRMIGRDSKITAFGSCFALAITDYLDQLGFDLSKKRNPRIYISAMGEGLVNVHALKGQLEWALENAPVPQGLWHGYKAEEFGYQESIRSETAEVFRTSDFFIITLGLSEVWYDDVSGGVFWRAVPKRVYDPSRHKFRVCSVAETKQAIARMYELIRRHVPQARVLFTVSPVPLLATFRPMSAMVASSASKAILRAALDEFLREHDEELNERLFYFPGYEMTNELFFWKYGDGRHIRPEVRDFIMKVFEATYCDTELDPAELPELYRRIRQDNLAAASKAIAS